MNITPTTMESTVIRVTKDTRVITATKKEKKVTTTRKDTRVTTKTMEVTKNPTTMKMDTMANTTRERKARKDTNTVKREVTKRVTAPREDMMYTSSMNSRKKNTSTMKIMMKVTTRNTEDTITLMDTRREVTRRVDTTREVIMKTTTERRDTMRKDITTMMTKATRDPVDTKNTTNTENTTERRAATKDTNHGTTKVDTIKPKVRYMFDPSIYLVFKTLLLLPLLSFDSYKAINKNIKIL